MKPTYPGPRKKPTVRVKPYSYQPSKAELEEEIHLTGTPDELARVLLRDVTVTLDK